MEENENAVQEPIKEARKGSYITGTIGAILGGIMASVPWILVYTFGNMIVAALALLIAGGALLGYKLLKGRIGKAVPVIIAIISIIVVTLITLVICPIILMAKEGMEITIFNFKMLYASSQIKSAIIQDLIISLLFTALGITSVIRSISVQIKKGASVDKLQINTDEVTEEQTKENKKKDSTKLFLGIVMVAIIVAMIAYAVIMGIGEKYTIPETDIELSISSSQLLCGTKEELIEVFGEQYAEYYTFAILENISLENTKSEYEIYGTLINKSDVEEEYDFNSLVQSDRDYIATYWGEEGTSQVSDIKLGNRDFKTYSYKYTNQSGSKFRAVIYLCEVGDKYLWIDLYADGSFEDTRANAIMSKLFEK